MNQLALDDNLIPYIVAAGALIVAVGALLLVWLRKRRRSTEYRLRNAVCDLMARFVIPDGDEGEIEVEYALLTPRGVVIIDIKDIDGNVFGSDAMQDWTVISERRRFTFNNPQHALYDRLAAVRRIVTNIPVTGFVAFTNRARFTKGQPSDVVMLERLLDDLQAEKKKADAELIRNYRPHWDVFRETVVTAQVGHLLKT